MLRTQITFIEGFGASSFHAWHENLRRQVEKLSLESFREGHEDAYNVSHQTVFFDYLSYFVG